MIHSYVIDTILHRELGSGRIASVGTYRQVKQDISPEAFDIVRERILAVPAGTAYRNPVFVLNGWYPKGSRE